MKNIFKTILSIVFAAVALTAVAEPSLEVNSELIYQGTSVAKGTQVQYARFTATAADLTGPVSVYMTGANKNLFSVDVETINNGVTEVIVSYAPNAVGKHSARINFDSSKNPEVSCGYTINAVCIDPNNPPTIIVDHASLTQFTAKVGESHAQKFTVTTKGLPDYGSVKVDGTPSGAFLLSNTMLLKENTVEITLTFTPKQEGTFIDTITLSGLEAESVSFTVTGVCGEGRDPEQKEGDDLPLDPSNPQTLYTTSFDGVLRNKPLAVEGWKNLALVGTRAWWGYDFEGNGCAKVTPFDSFVPEGAGEDCQMMLVSPALNFKDAATKLVTFRLMGQYLSDEQTDILEVCYIDLAGGEMYVQPLAMSIPATTDENNEWFDYVIDFDGQDIADTFFIGFRFKSTRGIDCSATYYVDDFSWGRTDVKQVKVNYEHAGRLLNVSPTEDNGFAIEGITVEGHNLTSNIEVSLYGADKTHFVLGTTSLPAAGGAVTLTIGGSAAEEPIQKGETYGVSLVTKASGAPTLYTDMFFYITDILAGINGVNADARDAEYFTIDGRRAHSVKPGAIYIMRNASAGTATKVIY